MALPVNQTDAHWVDGNPEAPGPSVQTTRRWLHWLRVDAARLLWPSRCQVCTAPGLEGLDLCAACADALPWNHTACPRCALPLPAAETCGDCLRRATALARRGRVPALDRVHAGFVYAAPVDRLLPRFKFHRDLAAGALLSQLLAESTAGLPRPDALVPVPLHRARLRRRGYDQALELARPLACALDLPLRVDLLQRLRATAPQSELSAAARRRNLRGAFAVAPHAPLPARVALVDDVMTTGATLHAAADALKRAGVQHVEAWVCARVP
ncbi:ComF family protein [Lysobacter solisilvae (ex Woo and Kim 2020)]|uniref:ComF family protein n=1 Tax=Agrilutibacter terrestris TaxID=2865112 RepID=A0A7H0FTT2_9GAMM|nr:ComF family protein [Lysobacter terrestris]QNP39448.1 ComF family protein [Lysobacter terrestris]